MNSKPVYFAIIAFVLVLCILCIQPQQRSEPRFKMYGSMRCGYTVKMLNYLRSKGQQVNFVDVNTPEGSSAFDKLNIRGVPYTIDMLTGENISGFRKINL